MGDTEIDWARLDRFVRGEGTAEELEASARWVKADVELCALADAMGSIGNPPGAAPHAWDEQAMWQRIRRRMPWSSEAARLEQASRVESRARAPLRFPRRSALAPRVAGVAAASLMIAGVYSLFIARSEPVPPPVAEVAEAREVRTRRGQRAVLDLSDGSRVTLGAASRLRIPATFSSATGPREVELSGEGYFDVQHDTLRPFRVHTTAGIAEDLGTTFVVTAYPETRGMQVVVATGIVALRRKESAPSLPPLVTLTKGHLARLDRSGTVTVTTAVDLSAHLAWTHGEIRFDATHLSDAIPVLSRWYGIDIRLGDKSLARRRITASFTDKSPDEVLRALSLLLRLRVERHGESITLHAQ